MVLLCYVFRPIQQWSTWMGTQWFFWYCSWLKTCRKAFEKNQSSKWRIVYSQWPRNAIHVFRIPTSSCRAQCNSKYAQSRESSWQCCMESFFVRFKDTLRRHFFFSSQDDLYDVVAKCVHYFKHETCSQTGWAAARFFQAKLCIIVGILCLRSIDYFA